MLAMKEATGSEVLTTTDATTITFAAGTGVDIQHRDKHW